MSLKTIVSLIALVIVVAGAWYYWVGSSVPAKQPIVQDQAQQAAVNQQAQQPGTHIQADSSLDADLSAIDSQVSAANDASASANSSDTPVAQTE